MNPKPHVSPNLVAYLQGVFPDRCPNEAMTERQIWMAAGAARVVQHLAGLTVQVSDSVIDALRQ